MPDETKAQSVAQLEDILSIERWLLGCGLVPDSVQQNLVAYGFLSSEHVQDVEVMLDVRGKTAEFKIILLPKDLKKYERFQKRLAKYTNSTSLWGKWMLLRLLKKSIKTNIDGNLRRFMRDYMPQFTVKIEVKST